MRVKVLVSLVAGLAGLVAITATTESRAGDEELVNAQCTGGSTLVVTGNKGWHPNAAAPWKWDGGNKISLDEHQAKFSGCKGTLKAYVCSGTSCKGPIEITLK